MKRKSWFIFMVVSLALVGAGLAMGEYRSVLQKAITVCLDCIGIG